MIGHSMLLNFQHSPFFQLYTTESSGNTSGCTDFQAENNTSLGDLKIFTESCMLDNATM